MGLFNSLKIVNCLLTDSSYKMNFMHCTSWSIFKATSSSRLHLRPQHGKCPSSVFDRAVPVNLAKPELLAFLAMGVNSFDGRERKVNSCPAPWQDYYQGYYVNCAAEISYPRCVQVSTQLTINADKYPGSVLIHFDYARIYLFTESAVQSISSKKSWHN